MIYSVYIFHRNRCIFVAQYPQRGTNPALAGSDSAAATAAAAAAAQQQQQRSSSSGGGSSRQGSAFPHDVSLQRSTAGSALVAAPVPAAGAAAAAGSLQQRASNGQGGSCLDTLAAGGPGAPLTKRQQQTGRLLSGLLYSMRRFCEQVGPSVSSSCSNSNSSSSSSNSSSFNCFSTPHYKLHYLETPTGYGFACLSSPEVPYLSAALQHIYVNIFLETVIKSPSFSPSKPVNNSLFAEHLRSFLSTLPAWES